MKRPYRVHGHVRVPPDILDDFLRELPEHVALTRAESGCLLFEIVQRVEDSTIFDVHEAFVDHEAFLAHQERAAGTSWKAATDRIERHYSLPEC